MGKGEWQAVAGLQDAVVPTWKDDNLYRCDPYLVWADASTTARAAAQEVPDIAVLVELTEPDDLDGFLARLNPHGDEPSVLRFMPNGFEPVPPSRFITGLVTREGLAALVADVLVGHIERFTLQNSRPELAQFSLKIWTWWYTLKQLLKLAGPDLQGAEVRPPAAGPARTGTYLGIIDDGLPVLRLRDAVLLTDKPAHFWDQGWQPPHLAGTQVKPGDPEPDDPYWQIGWEFLFLPLLPGSGVFAPPRGFLYGRRMKRIASMGAGKADRDEYFLSRYFTPPPRQTHGAGVLGLLAPWLSGARGPVKWPEHVSGLAMVQLPTSTVLDTSGGSLAMRVLDGLRYILWQESHDAGDGAPDRSIVANVSYGVHAGPHDGTSMFERALAEMLADHPRLHVVLPVGNAARAGCHARRTLAAAGGPGDSDRLALQVLPDNPHDTFVELWLPQGAEVAVRIRPPGSDDTFEILEGEAKVHYESERKAPEIPRTIHFGAVYAPAVAQGTRGTMVLVAIGATRRVHKAAHLGLLGLNQQPRRDVLGAPGLWELTIQNLKPAAVAVDAWVERDDAPPDVPGGSRQAFFPDSCCEPVALGNATPEDTLNGIATLQHERLHVVGAMRADGPLSAYSAAGRGRAPASREGPDIVATADWSGAMPGVRTMGFVRGASARINGTSAACAVYARALAAQLADDPTKPPSGKQPPEHAPEVTCVTDSMPEADPCLRGQDRRRLFPFDIDL